MGIKYTNSLGLSKGLLDSELISQSSAQFAKKNGNNCHFFIKQLKRGNQVYLVRKGCLFANVLLIIEILHPFKSKQVMGKAGIKWCLRVGGWRGSWLKKFSSHPLLEIFRFQFSCGLHFRKPSTYSSWQKMIWSLALLYQKIGTQHIFSIPMLEILPIHPCGSHLC